MCGLLGSYFLPFTPSWTRHCLGKSLHLPIEPMLSFSMTMGLLVTNPTISLHRACYSFTSPFISCYPMGLRADTFAVTAHFFINLLLRASLAHLLLLYFFYTHRHFTRFFGLPRPNYHIFTSYYFLGLLAFKPTH